MFKCMSADADLPYQTTNLFASNEERKIFLILDPPRLLITTRNCIFASRGKKDKPSRLIHCNGKFILWEQFLSVESKNVRVFLHFNIEIRFFFFIGNVCNQFFHVYPPVVRKRWRRYA